MWYMSIICLYYPYIPWDKDWYMEVWTQETIRKNYVGDGKCSAPGPIVPWWSWNVFFFENSTLSDKI